MINISPTRNSGVAYDTVATSMIRRPPGSDFDVPRSCRKNPIPRTGPSETNIQQSGRTEAIEDQARHGAAVAKRVPEIEDENVLHVAEELHGQRAIEAERLRICCMYCSVAAPTSPAGLELHRRAQGESGRSWQRRSRARSGRREQAPKMYLARAFHMSDLQHSVPRRELNCPGRQQEQGLSQVS